MKSHLQKKGTSMDMSFDNFDEEKADQRAPPIVRQSSTKAGPLIRAGSFKEYQLQRANSMKNHDLSSNSIDEPVEDEPLRPPPFSRQPSTRVPIFRSGSFHREPLVRENSLLDNVRTRLHKLIADQQMEELEERFANEQKRLERVLLHAEIQKAVTKKVKELNTIEEVQSINSKGAAKSRVARTAGPDAHGRTSPTNPTIRRAHTTGTTNHHEDSSHYRNSSKSPPTLRNSSGSPSPGSKLGTVTPPHNIRNAEASPPVLAHVTFPSVAVPSLSLEKFNKTHAGDSVYRHNDHHQAADESDDAKDDVSDLDSQGSLGSLSPGKRHQLIIIRQKDINHAEIRAIITEKLPSPEKWAIDEHYTSPAFPALLRTSPKKENSRYIELPEKTTATSASISFRSVISAVSNKNNMRRGFDEAADEQSNVSSTKSASMSEKGDTLGSLYSTKVEKSTESERRFAPAPFMKTKSNSSILLTQVTPAPLTVEETGGVPLLPRSASISKVNVAKGSVPNPLRSSQLFALHGTDLHLGELQSDDILESRYRGWAPSVHTLSSKHPSTTNFY